MVENTIRDLHLEVVSSKENGTSNTSKRGSEGRVEVGWWWWLMG